jgi:YVTN family beta-propeller protein
MFRRGIALAFLLGVVVVSLAGVQEKPRFAGPTSDGFLLPNGWTISPAGEQVALADLPLNIIPLADNKHALVACSGYNPHALSLVDLQTKQVVSKYSPGNSWFGLAVSPEENKMWWSGANDNLLHTLELKDNTLRLIDQLDAAAAKPGKAATGKKKRDLAIQKNFRSGVCLDAAGKTLYSLDINSGLIHALDPDTGAIKRTGRIGGRPYDVQMSRNRAQLFVSDWAGGVMLVVDPAELRVLNRVQVGEHPNQIALHPRDDRVFVACASANCVTVFDNKRGVVTERIMTALFPRSPEGSTPDALAVAPDGKTLYVANADNNCVVVVDISKAGESAIKGHIPTGWYPTAVAITPDGKNLLVGVGKGNQSRPNPIYKDVDPRPEVARRRNYPYIGTLMTGALSIVPVPDDKQLAAYTAKVYRNCPYSDKQLTSAPHSEKTAIPTRVGDASPIKHVIYIIKENRTYDQVFGDIKKGNGDPALVMFGASVTPNHHKLAEEFVLLDNLYCNGQVSRDGHPWSTMAYNTDYIARDWHLTYSSRKGVDDDDGGNLEKAPSGYLWDLCARHGLSYRSYGEYGHRVSTGDNTHFEGRVPGLVGHVCPEFGLPQVKPLKPGQPVRDTEKVNVFLKEFKQFEQNNNLPRFIVMSLGEDHTQGTTPNRFTPQACVANNDIALGRLVQAVSESKYWPETAIFVIEDDAQNGPDHVDAQRTVGLVISPYVRRGVLDSTQYSTVSMIRTIELILGLPPLSQYDAAARPMFASFTDKPDPKPYHAEQAKIDVTAMNTERTFGALRSAKMDFSDYDRVDEFELNEILWKSIKGENAPVPPAVRRAIALRGEAAK